MMAYDHEKTPLSECLKIEAALTSDVHSKARLDAWVEHAKLLERDARRYYFLREADDVPVSFGKQFDEDCDSAMRGSAYDASRPSKATHPQPVTPAGGEVDLVPDPMKIYPKAPEPFDPSFMWDGVDRVLSHAFACGANGDPLDLIQARREIHAATHPPVADAALAEAYKQGWLVCTNWASRDDLISDIDSPAYIKARDVSLAALNQRGGGDHG